MMRLGLDFVRRRPAVSRSGAVLLAGGVLAMGISVQQYAAIRHDIGVVRENLGAATAVANRERGRPQLDTEQLRSRIQLANQVVQKRAIPWDALFRDIEAASEKDVGVLSIQPDVDGRVLRITGEARNAGALAAYIARLEGQPSLDQVYLAEHELHQEQGRTSLRFGLNASWIAP
jgi:Tfp pilus assembly protein PilN